MKFCHIVTELIEKTSVNISLAGMHTNLVLLEPQASQLFEMLLQHSQGSWDQHFESPERFEGTLGRKTTRI